MVAGATDAGGAAVVAGAAGVVDMVYRKQKKKKREGGERTSEKGDGARCAKMSDEGGIVGHRTMTPRCQSGRGRREVGDGWKREEGFSDEVRRGKIPPGRR